MLARTVEWQLTVNLRCCLFSGYGSHRYCLSWLRPEMNMQWACPPEVAARLDPRLATLLGFAGTDRYGRHPYKIGPAFATEYNGYPGDEVDYGAATDKDWNAEGGREAKLQDCFEPGDLRWLASKL